MMGDERGVSDLVSFTMIFMVVFASIGMISVFGFDGIDHVREHEQMTSAQTAMITISDQLNGIADHESPARSAEVRLGGGTLLIDDGPLLNVTVDYGDGNVTTWERRLGTLTYRLGDQRLVVTGGAVIRADDDSSILVREPPFLCTEEHSRLNLIRIEALEAPSISSSGGIQVRNHHQRTRLLAPLNRTLLYDAENVTLEFKDTEHLDAWERYFTQSGTEWQQDGSGRYTCNSFANDDTRGLILRDSRIGIRFIR